jgi:multidrug resistance efflux pump
MKSTNFRRKDTILRVIPEKAAPAKKKGKVNYDRLIYFAVLVLIGLGVLYYISAKMLYVKANGQVLLDNTMIRLTDNARIIKIYKNEGDSVKAGDTLFMYFVEQNPLTTLKSFESVAGNESDGLQSERADWINRERFRIEAKIAVNQTVIDEKHKLQTKNNSELLRVKNLVTLQALPYSRLEGLQKELDLLNADINKLKSENEQLNDMLQKLNIPMNAATLEQLALSGSSSGLFGVARFYQSPCDGLLNRLFKSEFETALRSEDVLSIQKRNNIYIKAYFEQKDLATIAEGDIVNVNFPDGSSSKGILKRFYLGTYPLPEEFQKKYEPVRRTIAADIYPLMEDQHSTWLYFNKLNAEITKFRF